MGETPLQHVLIVLSYLLVLLFSLLQAAPAVPSMHRGWVGTAQRQTSAESTAGTEQRFALTITAPTQGGKLHHATSVLLPAPPGVGVAQQNPPPPPAWLVWRMVLLTLALLVYAVLVHNRRDAPDDSMLASQVACGGGLCR
jgi:hypothetical protein